MRNVILILMITGCSPIVRHFKEEVRLDKIEEEERQLRSVETSRERCVDECKPYRAIYFDPRTGQCQCEI